MGVSSGSVSSLHWVGVVPPVGECELFSEWVWSLQWVGVVPPLSGCILSNGCVWSFQWVCVFPSMSVCVPFNEWVWFLQLHLILLQRIIQFCHCKAATIIICSVQLLSQPFIDHFFFWHAGRFPLLNTTLRCTTCSCWCLNGYLAPPLSTGAPTWITPTVNHQQWGCPRHCRLAWCVSLAYFCMVAYVWQYCRGSLVRCDNWQI